MVNNINNKKNIVSKLKLELRRNAADVLAERFRDLIIQGEIEAGYVFPNENDFCKELCVSRSTLREAYKALETTGFIKRVKGHGTVVNDFYDISKSAPFEVSVKMSAFDDLIEFREMIESELAKLAAERATESNIEKIKEALFKMKENASDISKLTYYDTKFHMEIAYASNNKLLIHTMKNVEAAFSEGVYNAFQVDTTANIEQAIIYHTNILNAIEQRDAAKAQELMRMHIRSVKSRLGITADQNIRSIRR